MRNFLKTLSQDYLDDILVRLTHHSAGIEGNTISFTIRVAGYFRGLDRTVPDGHDEN